MIIIEHHHELLLNLLQYFIQQHVHSALRVPGKFAGRFLQVGEHRVAKARHNLLDSMSQVTEEDPGVSIRMIQLIPNKRMPVIPQYIGNQRRLP